MEFVEVLVDSNYIYMIQFFLLFKNEVLEYLDNNGVKFEWKVVVVVFYGVVNFLFVREYIVSFVFKFIGYVVRKIFGGEKDFVIFNVWFFDICMRMIMIYVVYYVFVKFDKLMKESYDGFLFIGCKLFKCFGIGFIFFMGFIVEDCISWINFKCDMIGYFDLLMLVDFGGVDMKKWKIFKVFYNNQIFDFVDELVVKYENNIINKIFVFVLKGKDVLFLSY